MLEVLIIGRRQTIHYPLFPGYKFSKGGLVLKVR